MSDGRAGGTKLVPGRDCGGCTACCRYLTINTPEMKKLPGILCPHVAEQRGCKIHDDRPDICRNWFCAWRALPELELGDEWRPDRCGILVKVTDKNIPPEFDRRGLQFQITGEPSDAFWHPVLSWEPLLKVLVHCVAAKVPVFLAVPAPPGYCGKSLLLNHRLTAAHSRPRVIEVLTEAYRMAALAPKNKVEI